MLSKLHYLFLKGLRLRLDDEEILWSRQRIHSGDLVQDLEAGPGPGGPLPVDPGGQQQERRVDRQKVARQFDAV